jgi:hypothetical protein
MPLEADLSVFTYPVATYLDMLGPDDELFKFKQARGFQIVKHVTEEFPHYFRHMGLKFRLRLYEKDLRQLQLFSGHRYIQNLVEYLEELEQEDKLLEYKMKA